MAEYIVAVEETITKYVKVEARNKQEAIDEAENANDEDFYGHEFGAPEAVNVERI